MSNVKVGDLVKLFASPSYKRIWDAIVIDSVKEDGKVLFNYVVSPNPDGSIQICINILNKTSNPVPQDVEGEWKWTKMKDVKENIWVSDAIFVKGDEISFTILYDEEKTKIVKFPFKINSTIPPKQEETTEPEPEEPGEEPEEPEIPEEDEPLEDGTLLWGDFFGDEGNKNAWNTAMKISEYNFSGLEGHLDNAKKENITYTANDGVRLSTDDSASNVTSGNILFNGKTTNGDVDGIFEVSGIKLYKAEKLTLSYAQGTTGGKIKTYYNIGDDWVELGETGNAAENSFKFEVPKGTENIKIKFEHVQNNSNARIDNIRLVSGHVETQQIVEEIIAKLSKPIA